MKSEISPVVDEAYPVREDIYIDLIPAYQCINMTNCYKECERFFERYESIHFSVLIAYWIKAGYVGPYYSARMAIKKGLDQLLDLINQHKMLKCSDEKVELIEIVASERDSNPVCLHKGFCVRGGPGFLDALSLGEIGNVALTDGNLKKLPGPDGLIKAEYQYRKFHCSEQDLNYVGNFNPSPASLESLLQNIKDPCVLVIRGCDLLPPFGMFQHLSALEISGVTTLTQLPHQISGLTQLQSLTLSHLSIHSLPDDFFSCLTQLRWLVLRRCSNLQSIPKLDNLTKLQCLELSDLPLQQLPDSAFTYLQQLRWLILRGCYKLFTVPSIKKLVCLEVLDLGRCYALGVMISNVISLPGLQMLDLSCTAMLRFPALKHTENLTHLYLRDSKVSVLNSLQQLTSLRKIDLSGSKNIIEFHSLKDNKELEALDLSRTGIATIHFLPDLLNIRNLILQDCTCLGELPDLKKLLNLQVLDISGCDMLDHLPEDLSELRSLKELNICRCTGLRELREGLFDQMSCLVKLDLSMTVINYLPSFARLTSLRKLSLRYLHLDSLDIFTTLSALLELDLGGLKVSTTEELKLDFLEALPNLRILNLSNTCVEKVPHLSKLVNLQTLLLADCQKLKAVLHLQTLTNLETLDLSLPDRVTINNRQVESETQSDQFLSPPTNIRHLVLVNRPGVLECFPLESLGNLEFLDLRGTDDFDLIKAHLSSLEYLLQVLWDDNSIHQKADQGKLSYKQAEIHVVSTFYSKPVIQQPSGFDRFKDGFTKIELLVSNIHEYFQPTPLGMANADNRSRAIKEQLESMRSNLEYILKNLDHLESSLNRKIRKHGEGLLNELMDDVTDVSAEDFAIYSTNLQQLCRKIIRLKLLIPPKQHQVDILEDSESTKKRKKSPYRTCKNNGKAVPNDHTYLQKISNLASSYKDLTEVEKLCLLCFSAFPCGVNAGVLKSLVIKKRILIHWWSGEKLIEPKSKYEEMGKKILKVLEEKRFISTVMKKGRESGSCYMQPFVHNFVTAQANKEGFFDFDGDNGTLTPHFSGSGRACLLKSQDNFPSSCRLWKDYTTSYEQLNKFKTVRTLINVNEPVLDIKAEWFSKMKSLYVLHLGSWDCEKEDRIDVVDQNFFSQLKTMKQLRLLSLQGFPTMVKLPDSVCKLNNLTILNLRDCSYLEELPNEIGLL